METFTGNYEDPRSEEDKAKDFIHEEIFGMASVPYQWKEFNEADIPQYTIRNQNGSGQCGAFSTAKALGINNKRENGVYIDLLPEFIYQKKANATEGMYMQNMFDIAIKYGTCEDTTLSGDNLTEQQAQEYVITSDMATQALKYRGKNYVFMSPKNIDAIAQAIDDGYTPIFLLRCDISEWTKEPYVNPAMTSPFNINHFNPCIYAGMRNGVKTIVTSDSWGSRYGANGLRYISEDFINTRVEQVGYIVDLSNIVTPAPKLTFVSQLQVGSRGDEVKRLQEVLKTLGFFKTLPSGFFGQITKQAVIDYQKANNIQPLGIVGPVTRKALNLIASQSPQMAQGEVLTTNTTLMNTKPFYLSKTVWLGLLVTLIPFLQALQTLPVNSTVASILSGLLGLLVIVNRFVPTVPVQTPQVPVQG